MSQTRSPMGASRGATSHLRNIVNKTHAADLSVAFHSLSLAQQKKLFDMLAEAEQKGTLFSELDEDTFLDLTEDMHIEELAAIFETMPTDDVADLISYLPEEKSQAVLEKMKTDPKISTKKLYIIVNSPERK